MSFSRINGPGWAIGDKLTSAQLNALDVDHANSLDKSAAGDTLLGTIAMASSAAIINVSGGAKISANAASAILSTAANGVQSNISGGIQPTVAGGIVSNIANGIQGTISGAIQPAVAGGITSNVVGGIRVTLSSGLLATASGSIQPSVTDGITTGIANGITSQVAGGISTSTAGGIASNAVGGITTATGGGIATSVAQGIMSNAAGGIALNGGANDFPLCITPRTRVIQYPCFGPVGAGFTLIQTPPCIAGTASVAAATIQFMPHNGAVIQSVQLYVAVQAAHSSIAGMTFPSFQLLRLKNSGIVDVVTLASGGAVSFTAASGAAWVNTQQIQASPVYTTNQNNVADTTQFSYFLQMSDENGSNSQSGNFYPYFRVTYSGIGSLAFP